MDRLFDKLSRNKPQITIQRNATDSGNAASTEEEVEVEEEGIFSRKISPSLFIGTRGILSSTAAYALGDGPNKQQRHVKSGSQVHIHLIFLSSNGGRKNGS
mmetsp:Transcript_15983/g.33807  ORF Transcript_15983/g.33807 Transcript_15983/m.33807 type:complete len:101 (-) Transcript_15983:459-761(-)